ncbi:MAG TPA: tetratricopeptide repeat protein [Gallionella sp.]
MGGIVIQRQAHCLFSHAIAKRGPQQIDELGSQQERAQGDPPGNSLGAKTHSEMTYEHLRFTTVKKLGVQAARDQMDRTRSIISAWQNLPARAPLDFIAMQVRPAPGIESHRATLTASRNAGTLRGIPALESCGTLNVHSNPDSSCLFRETFNALCYPDTRQPIDPTAMQMKPGRNDPCSCGSGKKFKHCCEGKAASRAPAPTPAEFNALVTLFNTGRYAELESRASALAGQYPDSGFAWKLLGASLQMQGKNALPAFQKTAELMPNDAEAHFNLGVVQKSLGQLDDAVASYRRALKLNPGYAEAHSNLGNALKDLGRLDDAVASYRRALQLKPGSADAHNNLGSALKDLGQLDGAVDSYRRALQINPNHADAHFNLGNALKELGQLDNAVASYRKAVEIRPDFAEAHKNLGAVLIELGQLEDTVTSYRRVLELKPDSAVAHYNLSAVLKSLGRLDEAVEGYRHALEIKPDFAEAHSNLGSILNELGQFDGAVDHCRQAVKLKPDFAETHYNLGVALKDLGQLDGALTCYRRALEIQPDYIEAQTNLLFVLNYTDHSPEYCLQEARKYGRMVAKKVTAPFSDWRCAARPERLRVGLVSGDFRSHSVGFFLEGLLAHIDPARIELIAYPTYNKEDDLTARIKPYFSAWKPLPGKSDEAAARLVHADGVHILLDLSGHTAHNRLPVFAWKPAPVQVSWLGYFATTGVTEMDYLLADPYVAPRVEEVCFTETIWRLPESYLCFTEPTHSVDVSPLPALTAGYITFGCFNNLAKMNDAVVDLWVRVLHAVPGSRLLLKTKQLNDPVVCNNTRQRFTERGISPDRILLEGRAPRAELLATYRTVDIALDPFPYPGGTTSVEGLWMGVPIITRRGDRFLSHIGETIALNAGLPDWIAADEDDYVAKAVAFVSNLERLAALRAGLRQQVLASPVFDVSRFAQNFETALSGMWQTRYDNQPKRKA